MSESRKLFCTWLLSFLKAPCNASKEGRTRDEGSGVVKALKMSDLVTDLGEVVRTGSSLSFKVLLFAPH